MPPKTPEVARLGARLDAARDRAFVGREAALDLFRQALEADEPPFAAYFVHGPGGVGKTTLVRRLLRDARAAGAAILAIDGHGTPATSAAILGELGVERLDDVAEALGEAPRAVVALDTYELLAPLDAWVREELAPALPAHATLLISGRDPPSAAWRADPGWSALLVAVALGNLEPAESARFLAARGVPSSAHAAIHALTYGHPLALALVADLRREGDHALPELRPDVVQALLAALLRAVPSARHREALELAAIARSVDHRLLSELAEDDAEGSLFEWLRGLSFVDATERGLCLHDIARDALLADARARDAVAAKRRREAVAQRARAELLGAGATHRREQAALDILHLYRGEPSMRPYYAWTERLGGTSRPMRPDELDGLLALLREHEGDAAVQIARDLHTRSPEAFVSLESATGALTGFLVYLRLDAARLADEAARDPVIATASKAIAESGPLRSGEHAGLLRFWLWREGYQELGSPTHAAHSTHLMLEWCSAPGLGPVVVVVQRGPIWAQFLGGIGLFPPREPARAELDGRSFHLFTMDFRRTPRSAWMAGARAEEAVPILSRERFEEAVKDALKACAARPEALAGSPLLGSRAVRDWAEGDPTEPHMIRELLEVAVSALADERDDRPRRALELTFLRPAPTQELAAERLGMTFSTYRRQLVRGVDAVVEYLWSRELGG